METPEDQFLKCLFKRLEEGCWETIKVDWFNPAEVSGDHYSDDTPWAKDLQSVIQECLKRYRNLLLSRLLRGDDDDSVA